MVKNKDEILAALKDVLGDDASETAISLVEDVSDTLNDFDTKTKDSTNWEQKYYENDASWAKRYRDRFFNNADDPDIDEPEPQPRETPLTFEELFEEVK